jgi:hypothetical protein
MCMPAVLICTELQIFVLVLAVLLLPYTAVRCLLTVLLLPNTAVRCLLAVLLLPYTGVRCLLAVLFSTVYRS